MRGEQSRSGGCGAFGVDPTRAERYSLRQSRYQALAEDVGRLAREAQQQCRRLKLLDIGVGTGVTMRYLEVQPGAQVIDFYGADLKLRETIYKPNRWRKLFAGNLMDGYPEIASGQFDVVVCEQVLEHLPQLPVAVDTLSRLLKPGGTLFVGVPIFPHGVHLARRHLVPVLDRLNPWARRRGHVQAFSKRAFLQTLQQYSPLQVEQVRGFRIVSGGILRPLENQHWWWQMNRKLGASVPSLCVEIQVVARKTVEDYGSQARAA